MPDVVALASSGLLVAVSCAALRRLRARRFRAPLPGGAAPAREVEAVVFAALGAAGLGSLAREAVPAELGAALEGVPRLLLAAALPAWLLAERVPPRTLRSVLVALGAIAALAGAGAGPEAHALLASAGLAAAAALAARRRHAPAGGTPEIASAVFLLAAALALLAASGGAGPLHALEPALVAAAGVQLLRFTGEREHPRCLPRAPGGADAFAAERVLKTDLFGRIELGRVETGAGALAGVRRDFRAGALWLRPVAAVLARREARALVWLEGVDRVPRLLDRGRGRFLRSFVEGRPLAEAGPQPRAYFAEARRLLRGIHAAGVTHNDTHKVHNWLVTPGGRPALVDFQIAGRHVARTRWFRLCALEDVRHLLKHKRRFCAAPLSARERRLLERRSWIARGWLATVKPVYVLVTRRLLGWRDAEGRGGAPR